MRWGRWLHAHPQNTSHPNPAVENSDCSSIPPGVAAGGAGYVRLHADCGRAEFDANHDLVRVACPAVWCGSVSVDDNTIRPHQTWDKLPCWWSGWRIVDDGVAVERAVS
ncbi:hypothetical protein [Nocardia sp. XZ_19_369]|uniref:hypothetical protein n=1 Tax=Nocardia sp. XZ_19_369 TaxID=2769487 RepID=UPI0018901239|nr:hypothetical protein [Nocardia sp. XZ_19_369]